MFGGTLGPLFLGAPETFQTISRFGRPLKVFVTIPPRRPTGNRTYSPVDNNEACSGALLCPDKALNRLSARRIQYFRPL